jgi:hypothetical protein
MIERCHPIMEIILIDSFLDGIEHQGEKFLKLLQQDLNFEQKGKLVDLIGFEIIENSIPYIEDPENLIIDESSFDFCLSKIILSEVLVELVGPLSKGSPIPKGAPMPNQLTGRSRRLYRYGKSLKSQARTISKAADKQIAGSRQRLFGGGKGSIRDSLSSARTYAGTRTLGGATRAVGNLVGAGYHAVRGATALATGGARKLLSQAVMARGRQLQASPYKSYIARQRIQKAKEDIEARRQRFANVPGV